ncbi:hypothetical protein EJ03DRAFT_370485 [Teratosphaeria nubilosa]|uniref:Uncharacterized protein n=1 Tax=Teratosphaeria nubilosa TaxID=161662 RepID=A0A6G1LNB7_9PEZI|nr:hypothetical protein EJ03DRAFT_370485 [Teratosphaeria nubilosa]
MAPNSSCRGQLQTKHHKDASEATKSIDLWSETHGRRQSLLHTSTAVTANPDQINATSPLPIHLSPPGPYEPTPHETEQQRAELEFLAAQHGRYHYDGEGQLRMGVVPLEPGKAKRIFDWEIPAPVRRDTREQGLGEVEVTAEFEMARGTVEAVTRRRVGRRGNGKRQGGCGIGWDDLSCMAVGRRNISPITDGFVHRRVHTIFVLSTRYLNSSAR